MKRICISVLLVTLFASCLYLNTFAKGCSALTEAERHQIYIEITNYAGTPQVKAAWEAVKKRFDINDACIMTILMEGLEKNWGE